MALIFWASKAGSVVTANRPHMISMLPGIHDSCRHGRMKQVSDTHSWMAPRATAPVHATVTIPGSKSQTNRVLLLAALAAAQGHGSSNLSGALRSRDTDLMIGALGTLGLRVEGEGTE